MNMYAVFVMQSEKIEPSIAAIQLTTNIRVVPNEVLIPFFWLFYS